ncbi:hypothetical protein D3C80_1987060 [compost metagenome]
MIHMRVCEQNRIRLDVLRLRYRSRVAANKGIDNQRLAANLNLYTGMAMKNDLHSLSLPFFY